MIAQHDVTPVRERGHVLRQREVSQQLFDIIGQGSFDFCRGCRPQSHQFSGVAGGPCVGGFFIRGDADIRDCGSDDSRDQQSDSVPVGIRLHHRTNLRVRAHEFLHLRKIVFERWLGDLKPCVGILRVRRRQRRRSVAGREQQQREQAGDDAFQNHGPNYQTQSVEPQPPFSLSDNRSRTRLGKLPAIGKSSQTGHEQGTRKPASGLVSVHILFGLSSQCAKEQKRRPVETGRLV